jgi:hypothetical protein
MVTSSHPPSAVREAPASGGSAIESLGQFLAREQRARGLSDDQFASLLGVPASTWPAFRDAREPWPAAALARVLLRFPEALGLATEEVRRRIEPGEGWRWWHASAA